MNENDEENFMEDIKTELLELNFNVDSIGIVYWIEAIKIIKDNPIIWDMLDIYEYIAQKYHTTLSKVERGMRTAIEPAKENIQKKYCYYKKIKNQTFLSLIRFKLI